MYHILDLAQPGLVCIPLWIVQTFPTKFVTLRIAVDTWRPDAYPAGIGHRVDADGSLPASARRAFVHSQQCKVPGTRQAAGRKAALSRPRERERGYVRLDGWMDGWMDGGTGNILVVRRRSSPLLPPPPPPPPPARASLSLSLSLSRSELNGRSSSFSVFGHKRVT